MTSIQEKPSPSKSSIFSMHCVSIRYRENKASGHTNAICNLHKFKLLAVSGLRLLRPPFFKLLDEDVNNRENMGKHGKTWKATGHQRASGPLMQILQCCQILKKSAVKIWEALLSVTVLPHHLLPYSPSYSTAQLHSIWS